MNSSAFNTPADIWANLSPATSNPLLKKFPVAEIARLWTGKVPGGDEDYTDSATFPISNTSHELLNILVVKYDDESESVEGFSYLPDAPIDACYVMFNKGTKFKIICSDFFSALAMAEKTKLQTFYTIYPENLEAVALQVAERHPKSEIVICDDSHELIENLPPKIHQLKPPTQGFYKKAMEHPEEIIQKINALPAQRRAALAEQAKQSNLTPIKKYAGINGAALFCQTKSMLQDCMSLADEAATLICLYIFFTYFGHKVRYAPLLGICSPTKRCGKSTLLLILNSLVRSPYLAGKATRSSLEQILNISKTPILDELETYVHTDRALIGMLNAGVAAGAISMLTGKNGQVQNRITFGPKIYAMIGNPPDTIFDRSVLIFLLRKPVEDIKIEVSEKTAQLKRLQREIQKWCEGHFDAFDNCHVERLAVGNDRYKDNYAPLLRIAGCLSNTIEQEARVAASNNSKLQNLEQCSHEELLFDIQRVFNEKNVDQIYTNDLVQALCAEEDSRWRQFEGRKPLSAVDLAKMLKLLEIKPEQVRIASKPQLRGYKKIAFKDAFSRYCPPSDTASGLVD